MVTWKWIRKSLREGREGRSIYFCFPSGLLIFMNQSSPPGTLSPWTLSGCVAQVLESQIPNTEPYIVSRRKWKRGCGLCWLTWLGAVCWPCCGSLRACDEGFAETHIHGRHVERPSTIEPVLIQWLDHWEQVAGVRWEWVNLGRLINWLRGTKIANNHTWKANKITQRKVN